MLCLREALGTEGGRKWARLAQLGPSVKVGGETTTAILSIV